MEIVDKLDNKRQLLNKTSERHENVDGEYRQSVHTWIQNSLKEVISDKLDFNHNLSLITSFIA